MNLRKEWKIRRLSPEDLTPGLLDDFAHCQRITKKWVRRNDIWTLEDADALREWSAEKRVWITGYLLRQMERGGMAAGSFSDGRLTGFCCVDGIVSGRTAKYANLTMLFVDDDWKRRGIGTALLREARIHAARLGAEKLFISAIASEETVAFYLKLGCVDAGEIVEAFVDTEEDRCLELAAFALDRPNA